MKDVPGKGVPADFKAGDPEHGLPETLPLRYDPEGEVLNGDEILALAGQRTFPGELYGGDNQVSILRAREDPDEWDVEVQVENIGNQVTKAGLIVVGVYHPFTEAVLGEVTQELPTVDPGKHLETSFRIPTSKMSDDIVVIAWLEVDDLDEESNEAWFIRAEDVERVETKLAAYEAERLAKEFKEDDLESLGTPKAWVTDHDELCVIAWAQLDDLDPTGYLVPAQYWLRDASGIELPLESTVLFDSDWNISVLGRSQRPAPKVWSCFDIADNLCDGTEPRLQFSVLKISLGTRGVRVIDTLELEPAFAERIVAVCER